MCFGKRLVFFCVLTIFLILKLAQPECASSAIIHLSRRGGSLSSGDSSLWSDLKCLCLKWSQLPVKATLLGVAAIDMPVFHCLYPTLLFLDLQLRKRKYLCESFFCVWNELILDMQLRKRKYFCKFFVLFCLWNERGHLGVVKLHLDVTHADDKYKIYQSKMKMKISHQEASPWL